MFQTINKAKKRRLFAQIELAHSESDILTGKAEQNDLDKINSALNKAEEFTRNCQFDRAWNQIHIAEQNSVRCMTKEQRIIKANNLRIEASKITSWRQEQIFSLLGKPCTNGDDAPGEVDSEDKIIEALKIRNDFYQTRNHRMELRQASLDTLSVALVIIIAGIIAFSIFEDLINPRNLSLQIIISILFGALGATFSMANSLTATNLELKIPDQLLSILMTVTRLAIGSTAAFIILMLLRSGLLDSLFKKDILVSGYLSIVLFFLAGFSERWVVKILESVSNGPTKN
jgi:hypothetical protein